MGVKLCWGPAGVMEVCVYGGGGGGRGGDGTLWGVTLEWVVDLATMRLLYSLIFQFNFKL